MSSRYESLVSAARPNDAHGIALQLVGTGKHVLELGAAGGHVTKELIARGNTVVAVEIDESLRDDLATIAENVVITDLDRLGLVEILGTEAFDVVLAGDVLEHTVNTRLVLEEIKQLIRPGGYLVISVPNIAHGDVRLALLNGEFRYRDVGILDRTHRTFFTRETLIEFLCVNGFGDLEVFSSTTPVGTTEIRPELSGLPEAAIDYVLRDPLSAVYQYIVKAVPKIQTAHRSIEATSQPPEVATDPKLSIYESALMRLTVELSQANEMVERLTREAESSERISASDQLILRDYALGVLAELGEARAQLTDKEAEIQSARAEILSVTTRLANEMTRAHEAEKRLVRIQSLEPQLEALRNSSTWKIGRFFMLPVRVLRRLLRR